jgi:hypothetical protein
VFFCDDDVIVASLDSQANVVGVVVVVRFLSQ